MKLQQGSQPSGAVSTQAGETGRRAVMAMIVLFLAAGFVATLTVTASGQAPRYEMIKLRPVYLQPGNVTKMTNAAKKIAGTRDENFPQLKLAEAFFKTYVPARITHPDALSEITPLISEAMLRLSAAQRSRSPYANKIILWVYNGLKPVAQGNYQPAARISAISAMSRIDEVPGGRQAPKPFRTMLTDFLPIYEDEGNPDGVRAAALQGMHRYVMYAAPSVTGATLTKLKSLMNDLLTEEPPADRSAKAHAYLQRFAVDILSMLRGRSDPALGQQLISISTEADKPDLIALHSAARIGEMATDLQGKVDAPDEILGQWAVRAMNAFAYEANRLEALTRPKQASPQPPKPDSIVRSATESPAASGGTYGGEGESDMEEMDGMEGMDEYGEDMESEYGMDEEMDMMMGPIRTRVNPQPPEVLASRRKLNHVLQQLHLGATGSTQAGMPREPGGLLAGVADDKKAAVETWVTSMGEVLTGLNDETLDDRKKYIEGLQVQIELLRTIAGPAAEAAEAAASPEIAEAAPAPAAAGPSETAGPNATVGADPAVADQAAPAVTAEEALSVE